MSGSALAVPPRKREVDVEAADAQHAERPPHSDDLPESAQHGLECRQVEPEDLDVEILDQAAEMAVADRSAHQNRPAPGVRQRLCDLEYARTIGRSADLRSPVDLATSHANLLRSDGETLEVEVEALSQLVGIDPEVGLQIVDHPPVLAAGIARHEIIEGPARFPGHLELGQLVDAFHRGDVVGHDSTIEDDFFSDMKKYVKAYKAGELMDYTKLFNPFVTGEGKKNPHKSYGYLIQPKLSQKFKEFIS